MAFVTSSIDAAPPKLAATSFALSDVRLLDGPFKRAMDLDGKYVLSLEPNRLLAGFRSNAGLEPKAKNYGGWESRGLEGHSFGHYLSGCALFYAATGDAQYRERIDYCVSELAACQDAAGNGFLGGMPKGREMFDQLATGHLHSKGGFDLNGGWVPWYNQHKLFAGLCDVVTYTSDDKAKHVLIRLADWAINVCAKLDDKQMQEMLAVEHGGMLESLLQVYALTGDEKYLTIAKRFWQAAILDPLVAGRDDLTGKHANTQVPKVIGAARLYELTGDDRGRKAAAMFWDAVVNHRSFVTGSNSDREHFFPLGLESKKLGPQNGETCNVYNMLKLTSHLHAWDGRADRFDYYERALVNHILGSIDPDTGMTTYFQSLEPGRFKVYGTPHDSFWCCTGTGMENHGRYGSDIYTQSDDGRTLDVNLFIASELTWRGKGIVLRQETAFPESDTTQLTLKLAKPTQLAIRIRVPNWAEQGIEVSSAATAQGKPGSGTVTIDRLWQDGDRISIRMPMSLRLQKAIDDSTVAAVAYGPLVLAAQLGREDFPQTDNVADHVSLDRRPTPAVPVIVADTASLDWLKPVQGKPQHFQTSGVGRPSELTLAPFYAIHHERYAVYLRVTTPAEYAVTEQKLETGRRAAQELAKRTIDEITFGEQQPEQDHGIEAERSRTGRHGNRPWRDATSGGFFSVRMKARPGVANKLRCTYWGGDNGRTFDILINDKALATQTLSAEHPDAFFDIEYALPAELIAGAEQFTLTFRPKGNSIAGGVFTCRTVTAESQGGSTRPETK